MLTIQNLNLFYIPLFFSLFAPSHSLEDTKVPDCGFHRWIIPGSRREIPEFYKAYQNSTLCQARAIFSPKTQDEVIEIVQRAIAKGIKVKAFGSRHSVTDIICTEGIAICMRGIRNIRMEPDGVNVTVSAGMTLKDAAIFLHNNHRAIQHIPTFSRITIGGAIGTGAHGSSLTVPSAITDYVVGVKFIDGRGQVRFTDNPEEIRGFQLHLGLLGVILEVKLTTVPQFKMEIRHEEKPDSYLLDQDLVGMARQNALCELWWFPSWDKIVIGTGNPTKDYSVPGEAVSNFIPAFNPDDVQVFRNALELIQTAKSHTGNEIIELYMMKGLTEKVPGKQPIFGVDDDHEEEMAKWPVVCNSHQCLASGCDCYEHNNKTKRRCIWCEVPQNPEKNPLNNTGLYIYDQSISIDVRDFKAAVQNIRQILSELKTEFPMMGIYIRFTKQSNALMSKCWNRECVHFEWISIKPKNPNNARLCLAGYQAIAHSLINEFGGRAHYGKNGPSFHTRGLLAKGMGGNIEQFRRLMTQFDPNRIFVNKFGERVIGIGSDRDRDPNLVRCGLADACVKLGPQEDDRSKSCETNNECAEGQSCIQIPLKAINSRAIVKVCRDNEAPLTDPIGRITEPVINLFTQLESISKTLLKHLGIETSTLLPDILPILDLKN